MSISFVDLLPLFKSNLFTNAFTEKVISGSDKAEIRLPGKFFVRMDKGTFPSKKIKNKAILLKYSRLFLGLSLIYFTAEEEALLVSLDEPSASDFASLSDDEIGKFVSYVFALFFFSFFLCSALLC